MTVLRTLDRKLVAAAVSTLLTLLVTKVIAPALGLDPDVLDDVLIPGYLRVDEAIALAAGAVAGYLTSNDGTVLRTPLEEHDGNPDVPRGANL